MQIIMENATTICRSAITIYYIRCYMAGQPDEADEALLLRTPVKNLTGFICNIMLWTVSEM